MRHGVKKTILLATLLLGGLSGRAAAQSLADLSDASAVRQQPREEVAPATQFASAARPAIRVAAGTSSLAEGLLVGAVQIEGATALPVAAFAPAIQPYLGRQLGRDELRSLAADVAGVARQAGYGLASARVPQQRLANGILRVKVDEGRIDAVEVSGDGASAVQPLLNRLISGRPIKTVELERQLLLAGDVAGVSTRGARIEDRGGVRTLLLQALRRPAAGRITTDNWGSSVVGPVIGTVTYDLNGLVGSRDRLSLGGSLSIQPREYQFASAAYTAPIGSRGTEVSLSGFYGHLRPGAELRNEDLAGRSLDLRAGLSHPLLRARSASLWASVEAAARNSDVDRAGSADRRDRIRSVAATLSGLAQAGGGRLRGRLALIQGMPLLGATQRGSALASRSDAGAGFTKVEFYTSYQRAFGRRFSVVAALTGQVAATPLLSSMEMGLGGRSFLRAYDYRELSGDSGAAASVETRFDLGNIAGVVTRTQLYAYADAGSVHNLRAGRGGGSLASAGGGVRFSLATGLDASVEAGIPLKASPYDASPKPRFSFSLSHPF
ncbi:MAG: ShlB/FhaC/HecB family hemolysin secretion/activation protein [Alphaproteobacteria bacterium]|nr:ShlB/FhaC/HecB family hemolysin secretion/activation protein [Alphaproteobacteria bacterium]MBV9373015.1 ShlB/FhaC/HecB family hemolysin secretion/activation protein [Alphaproteobacteria bacterium]MBV9902898.1 ShlB/FhaC/HecB family hemolysin secretion/activation protein [Alphaproteobacteria bacterium]